MLQWAVFRSWSRSRSCPEPPFLAGAEAGAEKITQFRLRLRLRLHYKGRRMKSNCNFLKFLIIIVKIIFGVKKIKMFILVDPSRGFVRVYWLYVCSQFSALQFTRSRSRSRSRSLSRSRSRFIFEGSELEPPEIGRLRNSVNGS